MKKVYVVGGCNEYVNWILPLGFEITRNIEESDLVCFTGGEDVDPSLYGQPVGSHIYSSLYRDKYEKEDYLKSVELNIPCIGICRGGQFLTVMNGYSMVQHMSHPSNHLVNTIDGKEFMVTSSHHNQFLLISNNLIKQSDYLLIAWANKLSKIHLDGNDKDYKFEDNYQEPEMVLYDGKNLGRPKCLAIQGHPEYCTLETDFVKYCQELIIRHLLS